MSVSPIATRPVPLALCLLTAVAVAMATLLAVPAAAQVVAEPGPDVARTPSQIGISPQLFEIDLDQPLATHAYRLHNLGGQDTRVRVRVINWTLDEAGELVVLPPTQTSLDRWLVVNPLELDLPAGSTRAVRFSVRPAQALPPGEYRAALVFEEDPPAPASVVGERTMSLTARFRITSAIYASSGEVSRSGSVESVELRPDRLLLVVRGEGTGHVRPTLAYTISRDGGSAPLAQGEISRAPVLPDSRRSIETELPADLRLAPGRYVVTLQGTLGDADVSLRRALAVADPD
jgi:fimbrial chaperone protein